MLVAATAADSFDRQEHSAIKRHLPTTRLLNWPFQKMLFSRKSQPAGNVSKLEVLYHQCQQSCGKAPRSLHPRVHQYQLTYEPIRAFTLIWLPAWPHFWVLQNNPKVGKTVYLHANPGTRVQKNTTNLGSSMYLQVWVQIDNFLNKENCQKLFLKSNKKICKFFQVGFKYFECHWNH